MDLPPVLPPNIPTHPAPAGNPKRHGCLLTWLILMLIADVLTIIFKLLSPVIDAGISQVAADPSSPLHGMIPPSTPSWANFAMLGLAMVDIVAVVFIFKWKKWAFFTSVGVSILMLVVFIAGGGSAFDGLTLLISPVLLYVTLQFGGENKGWKQLQ